MEMIGQQSAYQADLRSRPERIVHGLERCLIVLGDAGAEDGSGGHEGHAQRAGHKPLLERVQRPVLELDLFAFIGGLNDLARAPGRGYVRTHRTDEFLRQSGMNEVERESRHSALNQGELRILPPELPDDLADSGAWPANAGRQVQFHPRLYIPLHRFPETQHFALLFGRTHIQTFALVYPIYFSPTGGKLI